MMNFFKSVFFNIKVFIAISGFLIHLNYFSGAQSTDSPQWGQKHSRNMVSYEHGLPEQFNPGTGENIKWVANLGSEAYSTPVISGGKVLIGANNIEPRDPRYQGDRSILLCLNEKDKSLN